VVNGRSMEPTLRTGDRVLVRWDAALGINVKSLAQWTASHPTVSLLLSLCYGSLMLQFLLPLIALGLHLRDRQGLWEYVFHFHFCLVITIAALALKCCDTVAKA